MYIFFDPNTLHTSKSGLTTGVVYFDFGDRQFPMKNWNDFVVVVANWWLTGLRDLNGDSAAEFRFMDGPYRVIATVKSASEIRLSCIEDRDCEMVVGGTAVRAKELKHALIDFGERVSCACKDKRIASKDVDDLRTSLLLLKRMQS